ncbi:MAG: SDR family oxidoreductase [Candidatus Odinarchaeota archaeon]
MNTDLSNRTCIISGANSGIGKATAFGLAKMGASIVMLCRNEEKGNNALKEIKDNTGNQSIELMIADLQDYDSIKLFAQNYKSTHDKLHILINNAGIMKKKRETNNRGHETTFATNHLGHFLLTNLLVEMLQSSAPARIINVSSGSHKRGKLDFNDLMLEQKYGRFKAYNNTKLANILFTYELARRLEDSGVTVNAVHPGAARTNFGREFSERTRKFLKHFKRFTISAEEAAKTSIFLASSPEVENISGKYWIKCKQVKSSKYSYNTSIQKRLWDVSKELNSEYNY